MQQQQQQQLCTYTLWSNFVPEEGYVKHVQQPFCWGPLLYKKVLYGGCIIILFTEGKNFSSSLRWHQLKPINFNQIDRRDFSIFRSYQINDYLEAISGPASGKHRVYLRNGWDRRIVFLRYRNEGRIYHFVHIRLVGNSSALKIRVNVLYCGGALI